MASIPIAPTVAIATETHSPKQRMYRERRKNEWRILQSQEKALSQELARVRQATEDERARTDCYRPPGYFMWKMIAMQQLNQRLLAEAEQRQLVTMVNAQASYIQAMNAPSATAADDGGVILHTKRQRAEDTEVTLCNAYIRRLEEQYDRIDELMDECGIANLPETECMVNSVHRRSSDHEVEYFQRLHQYVDPHSLHQTATLLWELAGKKFRSRGHHERYVSVPDPVNMAAMKFRETCTLETGAVVSLLHRHVARRWFDDGRVVMAWVLVTEGEGVFSGMCLEETGWVSLRPSTRTKEPGTQIEICSRQVPMHFKNGLPHDRATAQRFHRVTQNLSDGTETEVIHSLENLLLGDTLLSN